MVFSNKNNLFLNKLKEILAIQDHREFSRMCEKKTPNMRNYLNGGLKPGDRVLEDCLLNATISRVFEKPLDEGTRLGQKAKKLRDRVLRRVTSDFFKEPRCPSEVRRAGA